jgi:sugar O-acyltransferase (sialic acid O-acetyltransferase NeuD family)
VQDIIFEVIFTNDQNQNILQMKEGEMTPKIVIIGAGGFGREVLDICDACNQIKPTFDVLGFIVDEQYGSPGTIINGVPILGDFSWLEKHVNQVSVACSVGAPQYRRILIERAREFGCKFINLIHPQAIITKWVTYGEGVIICAASILTNQIIIGNHVQINLDCTIGHDVVLEDYSTLSPGVHISGNVRVGEGCFVGTGANVIEKLILGEWSIVGAGSTIVNDVPANSTVVGVPGKVIKTMLPGWHAQIDEG